MLACARLAPRCPGHWGRAGVPHPSPHGSDHGHSLMSLQGHVGPSHRDATKPYSHSSRRVPAVPSSSPWQNHEKEPKKKPIPTSQLTLPFIKDLDLMAWRNTWSHRAELYGAAVPRVWAARSPPLSAGASGARFGDGLQTPILFVGLCLFFLLRPTALSLGNTGCPDFILSLSQVAFHSSPTLL